MIKRISILLLLLPLLLAQEKVFYLYKNGQTAPQALNTSGFLSKPDYLPINCDQKDCSSYKATQYPTMMYWRGVGFAFQKISPPTQEKMRQHLKNKQTGPLSLLRIWIESWNQLETVVYCFAVATFLYIVFTFLFSPAKKKQKMKSN